MKQWNMLHFEIAQLLQKFQFSIYRLYAKHILEAHKEIMELWIRP